MKIIEGLAEGNRGICSLIEDSATKELITEQLSKEIQDYAGIIARYPREQILAITYSSEFASRAESERVGNIIWKNMRKVPFPLPLLEEETKDVNWAERCVLALGFFRDYYQLKWQRRGSPKPQYYAETSIEILQRKHEEALAKNFLNWTNFLRLNFQIKPLNF